MRFCGFCGFYGFFGFWGIFFWFSLNFCVFFEKMYVFFIANIALLEENFFFLFDFSPSRCLFCFFLCISCSCGFFLFFLFSLSRFHGFSLVFSAFYRCTLVRFLLFLLFLLFENARARFYALSFLYALRVPECPLVFLPLCGWRFFCALFFFSFNKMKNIRILS